MSRALIVCSIVALLLAACAAASTDWQSQLAPLDSAPMAVEIPIAGGSLPGLYYPAAVNPAPVIVLIHWAGGSYWDWEVMARWLQNRGETSTSYPGTLWSDPYWFPTLDKRASFAVLTFNYWNSFIESVPVVISHLSASEAALDFASTLEGVDADRMLTMGASLGADAAPHACAAFNASVEAGEAEGKCLGSLSFSPASDTVYVNAATQLLAQGGIVYCLAATEDLAAARGCEQLEHENFHPFIYSGSAHGYQLVDPALLPSEPYVGSNALELVLLFLKEATGLPVAK